MKKLFALFIALVLTFCFVSCQTPNQLIRLNNDEVLIVGNNVGIFKNYVDTNELIQYINYTVSVTHKLNRSTYSSNTNSVLFGGYYYYWSTTETEETETLGTATIKTTYTYEYLPYSENEQILVKTIVKTEYSYPYEGGWIEKPVEVFINLNGYFSDFADLQSKCPELAQKIDTNQTRKYYVDTSTPATITSSERFYDNYFYIESN